MERSYTFSAGGAKACLVFAAFFSVAHAVLVLVALLSGPWYGYELGSPISGNSTRNGYAPFAECYSDNSSSFNCELSSNVFPIYKREADICNRTSDQIRDRLTIVRVFTALSGGAAFISFIITLILLPCNIWQSRSALTLTIPFFSSIVTLCICAVGIVLSIHFYMRYSTCGYKVCALVTGSHSGYCKEHWYATAWIYWLSTILSILSTCFSFSSMLVAPGSYNYENTISEIPVTQYTTNFNRGVPPPGVQGSPAARTPASLDITRDVASVLIPSVKLPFENRPENPPANFPLPEGEWVWDPKCRMYWCEEQYLFIDTTNGHFYDPNSGSWYDPATEKWYNKEK